MTVSTRIKLHFSYSQTAVNSKKSTFYNFLDTVEDCLFKIQGIFSPKQSSNIW